MNATVLNHKTSLEQTKTTKPSTTKDERHLKTKRAEIRKDRIIK